MPQTELNVKQGEKGLEWHSQDFVGVVKYPSDCGSVCGRF